jgi:hypothetical protein
MCEARPLVIDVDDRDTPGPGTATAPPIFMASPFVRSHRARRTRGFDAVSSGGCLELRTAAIPAGERTAGTVGAADQRFAFGAERPTRRSRAPGAGYRRDIYILGPDPERFCRTQQPLQPLYRRHLARFGLVDALASEPLCRREAGEGHAKGAVLSLSWSSSTAIRTTAACAPSAVLPSRRDQPEASTRAPSQ